MLTNRAPRGTRRAAPGRPAPVPAWTAATAALLTVALAVLSLGGCSSDTGDSSGGAGDDAARRPGTGAPFWVDPRGNAAAQVAEYRDAGQVRKARLIERIARQPVAEWLGGEDPGRAGAVTRAAERAGRRALLVLYNLPHRDCGQYSQGGAAGADAYRAWLDKVVQGIGDRRATVVVEPDALPHLLQQGCTPQQFHEERYALLSEAVSSLAELPATKVYLDAGNPDWVRDLRQLVEPLRRAGIAEADGFALNVSNYQSTTSNISYGRKLSALLGGKNFVIDTSRNGNGPAPGHSKESWCNPPGRALGEPPTTRTGEKGVDAYLWIKRPGESDGSCKGGPAAGEWFAEYALELARNAGGHGGGGGGGADG